MKIEEKKQIKHERILEAALDLVSEQGLQDTPVAVLADRAGVAAGTIYRYFKNKDDLLNELYRELNRRIHRAMLEGYDEEAPAKERFARICLNLLRYYLANPRDLRFIGQYIYTPHIAEHTYAEIYSDSLAPLVRFFRQAISAGIIKDVPIEMVFSFIHGPIDTLIRQHLAGRLTIDERIAGLTVETCWDALRKQKPKA